jgi:hypothetical protein
MMRVMVRSKILELVEVVAVVLVAVGAGLERLSAGLIVGGLLGLWFTFRAAP